MPKVPDIIPITDLRQEAAAALKRVRASQQPLIITQRGRAAAVMLSVEAYERAEHEKQMLRLLARGEQEIARGEGYDLDGVLAEADRLLAPAPRGRSASPLRDGRIFSVSSPSSGATIVRPPPDSAGVQNGWCDGSSAIP